MKMSTGAGAGPNSSGRCFEPSMAWAPGRLLQARRQMGKTGNSINFSGLFGGIVGRHEIIADRPTVGNYLAV
ncbi:hypothetical protein NLM24_03740 [Nocardia zapadnayensis]|nr:hypothetical protein [Nocardia zapadnayensis]MCX0269832.1 hypothetical protein [Nocardia zapadnayensis]